MDASRELAGDLSPDMIALARRELTGPQFEVWIRTIRDEMNSTQIAAELGVDPRTVREHRAKAHLRIRQALRYEQWRLEGDLRLRVTIHRGHTAYDVADTTAQEAIRGIRE